MLYTFLRNVRIPTLGLRSVVTILVLALAAVPAWGYIVILKDGSQITTREKYRVEGDKVYLILPSGTSTFFEAAEIDFEATDELNKLNIGTAKLIDEGETKQLPTDVSLNDKITLGDLVSQTNSLALPPPKLRQVEDITNNVGFPITEAGFIDLSLLPREPYEKAEIQSEVLRHLKGQGLEDVRIYSGTTELRPLVQIITASEASVFKALKDTANGIVQIHERFPGEVEAFEVLLLTDSRVRAGQFVLTPELASLLVTGRLDAPAFFLRYVEF